MKKPNKKVFITGSNGYIGNPLMKFLEKKGYEVAGIDNSFREDTVKSLTPIKKHEKSWQGDVLEYSLLKAQITDIKPDVIIHLAEIPSAPFSMRNQDTAYLTQKNNILGTLNVLWAIKEIDPKIHLIKLGTAGEYPDWLYPKEIEIPESPRMRIEGQREGWDIEDWEIPVPRYGGSWYHMSKLHDSNNCDYASRIWELDITDINQAPVYGYIKGTRFDYDSEWGTVVNRFVAQSLKNYPLTVYGTGEQQRGYIHLKNALKAIELVIQNRPKGYDIVHQLTETKTINEIASMVDKHRGCGVKHIDNPRAEAPQNEFNFEMKKLKDWGLKPITMKESLGELIEQIAPYRRDIDKKFFLPKAKWK